MILENKRKQKDAEKQRDNNSIVKERSRPVEGYKDWRGHGNLMSGVDLDFKDKGTLLLQIT